MNPVKWFDCKNENENAALNAAAACSAQMASTSVDSVELTASFSICTDGEPTFSFYTAKLKLCSQAFNDIGRIPQFDCSVSTMKPVCCRSNSLLCMGESLKGEERNNGKASREKPFSAPWINPSLCSLLQHLKEPPAKERVRVRGRVGAAACLPALPLHRPKL